MARDGSVAVKYVHTLRMLRDEIKKLVDQSTQGGVIMMSAGQRNAIRTYLRQCEQMEQELVVQAAAGKVK